MSMIIELENIYNVRDLGGMKGADERLIKPKKLIRSSALYNLSDKDIDLLTSEFNIKQIVDFRTPQEIEEKPDDFYKIKNAEYHHIASFESIQKVVTRDSRSRYMLMNDSENLTVEMAVEMIEAFYEYMATSESMKESYTIFFKILLNCNEGSTIWHCSLGKDRAGIAAALIEFALGVSYEDVINDYMLTQKYLDPDIELNPNNAFRVFYGVKKSFFESWFNSVCKNYDTVENYLEKFLGVGKAEIEQLQSMYLE